MQKPQSIHAPFSLSYTSQVPELIYRLGCTLTLSTYQAGKLIFLSAEDEHKLVQLPRNFKKAMGIAEDRQRDMLALATQDEITLFANSPALAAHYPKAPGKYDALYLPRTTYHTGPLDIHDLQFGKDGRLFAVNTLFSCISEIDSSYNFRPYWMPAFIDALVSEDRCHLNGMALQDGLPKYATAFNQGNRAQSWRDDITKSGVLIDIQTNEVVADGLPMPHSPRFLGDELYVLLSATGELAKIDTVRGGYEVVAELGGFVRGMALCQDYLFIAQSKLRKNSSTFAQLPFADKAQEAAIIILHLPTASIAGKISYHTSVDEIYDVHILDGKRRPNILNTLTDDHTLGLMTPDNTFWGQPKMTINTNQ